MVGWSTRHAAPLSRRSVDIAHTHTHTWSRGTLHAAPLSRRSDAIARPVSSASGGRHTLPLSLSLIRTIRSPISTASTVTAEATAMSPPGQLGAEASPRLQGCERHGAGPGRAWAAR
ncbi:hypothetical protein FOA52_005258 [Chlamydomonas sp. UWO 241]|nr:hypothetical protein FOA52_005258 [Chlamydomonas sp. UWO 241]